MRPTVLAGFSDELEKVARTRDLYVSPRDDPSKKYRARVATGRMPVKGGTAIAGGFLYDGDKERGTFAVIRDRSGKERILTKAKPGSAPVVAGALGGAGVGGLAGALAAGKGSNLKRRLAGGAIAALGGGSLGLLGGTVVQGKERKRLTGALNTTGALGAHYSRLDRK